MPKLDLFEAIRPASGLRHRRRAGQLSLNFRTLQTVFSYVPLPF